VYRKKRLRRGSIGRTYKILLRTTETREKKQNGETRKGAGKGKSGEGTLEESSVRHKKKAQGKKGTKNHSKKRPQGERKKRTPNLKVYSKPRKKNPNQKKKRGQDRLEGISLNTHKKKKKNGVTLGEEKKLCVPVYKPWKTPPRVKISGVPGSLTGQGKKPRQDLETESVGGGGGELGIKR